MQEHLFEPFYTTAENGTGLGLYVARELAHANFGDLTYLPEAKCFELTLPEKTND
ncbi:putative two-component system sensor protein [Neisseria meningitidis]|nr:putative two-component system sensor protein [Neisseria meningitidis]